MLSIDCINRYTMSIFINSPFFGTPCMCLVMWYIYYKLELCISQVFLHPVSPSVCQPSHCVVCRWVIMRYVMCVHCLEPLLFIEDMDTILNCRQADFLELKHVHAFVENMSTIFFFLLVSQYETLQKLKKWLCVVRLPM